ncbi:MAG: NUDIX hydrolase [Hyphomicrobiales bacterium]|nr:MAG: NUDIX hydrolase [Hyphomicrobiales bacterium]
MTDGTDDPLGNFIRAVPDGDNIERAVCRDCGFVAYENPKIVVGSVVRAGGQILMCRRAIEPAYGLWTLPAGYLELNETPEDGARREAIEEASADIRIDRLLAVYTVPRISQVQLIYRATLLGPIAPGPESLEVALFDEADIPWDEIAFPTVHWALGHDAEVLAGAAVAPFGNPPGATGDVMPKR